MLLFLLERPEPIDRASIIAVVLLIKLGELFLPFRLGLPDEANPGLHELRDHWENVIPTTTLPRSPRSTLTSPKAADNTGLSRN